MKKISKCTSNSLTMRTSTSEPVWWAPCSKRICNTIKLFPDSMIKLRAYVAKKSHGGAPIRNSYQHRTTAIVIRFWYGRFLYLGLTATFRQRCFCTCQWMLQRLRGERETEKNQQTCIRNSRRHTHSTGKETELTATIWCWCACMCVCMCVYASVRAYVHACVHACVCTCGKKKK